ARLPVSEKRWRHTWNEPPVSELMYIHFPSGDHCANQHGAPRGPIWRPVELRSIGTNRHGNHRPRSVISERTIHLPSGEGNDRCAIAPFGCGIYTSCSPERLSSAVTTFM